MQNRIIEAAWRYHNGTKLSWQIVNTVSHDLDWNNQPLPFKIYPQLPGDQLPRDIASRGVTAPPARAEEWVPGRHDLARLHYFAAGITRLGTVP